MPFTPTHALAVLPVAAFWRRLPVSALVIGSAVPDLPMYLPRLPYESYRMTHSNLGLLTFALPMGFLGYVLFQFLMKQPLFELLPRSVQSRTSELRKPVFDLSPSFFAVLCGCIVFGAWTHTVWDAFTHQGRWGTQLFPVLNQVWFEFMNIKFDGWKVLQHGSSIIGLPIIMLWGYLWLKKQQPVEPPPQTNLNASAKYGVIVLTLVLAVAVGMFVAMNRDPFYKYWYVKSIVTRMGFVVVSLAAAYSVTYHAFYWRRSETRQWR